MAGFNPNIPTVLGSEYLPGASSLLRLDSGAAGVACRFRSPGTPTISHLHVPIETVTGNPGLGLEIVSSLTPTVSYADYYPGTDTGATVTGFQDQGGGTANYSEIDDRIDGTDYHRNTAALAAAARKNLLFRGNSSGALSGLRVLKVAVGATIWVRQMTGNGQQVPVSGALVIDGSSYYGPVVQKRQSNAPLTDDSIAAWDLNPSTGIPWTVDQVDDIIDAADADTFGLRIGGRAAAQGIRVIGMWLRVWYCAENRLGYYYSGGQPTLGWKEYALSGTAALTANTSYYVVVSPLLGTAQNWLTVRRIEDPYATLDTSASGTGEHRQAYDLRLTARGGTAYEATARTGMLPFLLDASTAIQTPSQPYGPIDAITVKRSGGTSLPGQQFTTDGSTTSYGGVWCSVGWESATTTPDRPLTLELRSGAGAISGGGTLRATATLDPSGTVPGPVRVLVPFDAAYTTAAATQYHLLASSQATYGWKLYRLDTYSATVSSTTTAEVEGASQGGQTDSYVAGGTAYDRYELSAALVQAPTAPANVTATVTAGSTTVPPKVTLSWSATSITTAFDSYRVYRRPSRGAAKAWTMIGEIDVPTGYTAATVEAQHTSWVDYAAGWSAEDGPYEDGWDYAVTVRNATTGLESTGSVSAATRTQVTAPAQTWLTCNEAPYLNTPLGKVSKIDSSMVGDLDTYWPAGRSFPVTRRRAEDGGRTWGVTWRELGSRGDEVANAVRTAATSGKQLTVLTPRGDRIEGSFGSPKTSQDTAPTLDADATFVETSREPATANYNLPAGVVLDGSADYLTVPDNSDLDPASSSFSVVVAGAFANTASSVLSKGNLGTSDGYGIRRDSSNSLQFYVDGATTAGGPSYSSASWYDGTVRVAGGTSSGTAQTLYMDGASVATASVTHGSVSSALALVAGANNAGASGFMAIAPLRGFAVWLRALTAAEHLDAANYLLGVPGARMPSNPVLFVDLRDLRCWDGISSTFTDLSGYAHPVTAVSSPPTRGFPWPLGDSDRWT